MSNSSNPWAAFSGGGEDVNNPWSSTAAVSSPPAAATIDPAAKLAAEVSNLDTILFRFASTSDAKFEAAVNRVLPSLLPQLLRPEAAIRDKLIEIFTHINKRIKVLPSLLLPLNDLVTLYVDDAYLAAPNNAFFYTFTLMFIEKGFVRVDDRERSILVPHLLMHVSKRNAIQQRTILNILITALPSTMAHAHTNSDGDSDSGSNEQWKFARNSDDEALVLSFLLDFLLYSPSTSATVSEGLSQSAVQTLTNDGKLTLQFDALNKIKLSILQFLSLLSHSSTADTATDDFDFREPLLSDNDIFLHGVVGSCIGSHDVVREAENLLRRMKHLDLESPSLLTNIYSLYLGDSDSKTLGAEQRRSGASLTVKLKLLTYLCKTPSSVSATMLANAMKTLFDAFFAPSSNYRLKQSGLNFAAHVIQHAPLPQLQAIAQVIINALLKFLAALSTQAPAAVPVNPLAALAAATTPALSQSSIAQAKPAVPLIASLIPSQTSTLRGAIYHHLGLLSTRVPPPFTRDLKMMSLMFQALIDESHDDAIQQIHEGLLYLRSTFAATNNDSINQSLQSLLIGLLWSPHDKRVRLNALSCLNRLFPFSDSQARWQCIMASSDTSVEIRDEAQRGLRPFAIKQDRARDSETKEVKSASDEDVQMKQEEKSASPRIAIKAVNDKPYPPFPQFIDHTMRELDLTVPSVNDVTASQPPSQPIKIDAPVFLHLLDFVWASFADTASRAVTGAATAKDSEEQYAQQLSQSSPSSLIAYQSLIEAAFLSPLTELQSQAAQRLMEFIQCQPQFFAPRYIARLDWVKKYLLGNSNDSRIQMASLLATVSFGLSEQQLLSLMEEMTRLLVSTHYTALTSDALHGAILTLGVALAEANKRSISGAITRQATNQLIARLDTATYTRDAALSAAACLSIRRIGQTGPLAVPLTLDSASVSESEPKKARSDTSATVADFDRVSTVRRLLDLTRGSERKIDRVTEESVRTLGLIVHGDSSEILVQLIIDGLCKMVSLKHEEIHFAIGETLATIIDVCPEHRQSLLALAMEKLKLGSQIERSAACVWILCIIKYSQSLPQSSLTSLQPVLTVALTDSHAFTQEAAAKALALIYERTTDPAQKEALVNSLVATFTVGKSKVTDDSMVEIDSERGEFSTYKELMSVANDMGQPDLVYKFIDLASHHSIWQSKLGASFSLATILTANQSLSGKLDEMIPKLYLYQYDPNTKVQASMRLMWQSLINNPKQCIDQHFRAILHQLLLAQSSRQYRLRLAACAGLTDLISHRSFSEVGTSLQSLWENLFRCLDDVNGETRKTAVMLGNTLRQLCLRLGNPQYTNKNVVQQTLNIVLPLLLTQGLNSSVKESSSLSIKTMLAMIKQGREALRPHLPSLIGSLMESMSSMESATLSYLQFHTQSFNITDEQLELARLSAAKNTPLSDALYSCLQAMDSESLPSVLNKMNEVLTQGLGLPTLTAAAKFIISIVNSPTLSVSTAMRENTGQLMTTLRNGLNDQSVSVRKAFAAALGYLCKVARKTRIQRIVESLIDQCLADDASDSKRLSSGLALYQIINHGGDAVKREFSTVIAPVAFLALHDANTEVSKAWGDVFDELTASRDSGAAAYQSEIAALAQKTFNSQSWSTRALTYTALAKLIEFNKKSFASYTSTFAPLVIEAMPGRIWNGKEKLFDLATHLTVDTREATVDEKIIVEPIFAACVEQTKRNKTEYRLQALKAASEIAEHFPAIDAGEALQPAIESTINKALGKAGNEAQGDSGDRPVVKLTEEERKAQSKCEAEFTLMAFQSLGKAFPSSQHPQSQQSLFERASALIVDGLRSGQTWNIRVVMLDASKRVIEKAAANTSISTVSPSYVALVDAIVQASGDMKHSAVRAAAMEAIHAIVTKHDAAALEASVRATIRSLLEARRDDKDSSVLRLIDAIRARLDHR